MKPHKSSPTSYQEVLKTELNDPAFSQLWEAERVKRELISAIIEARITNKLSQTALAQKAGIKQPSLARLESGKGMPSLTTVSKIAHALGLKIDIQFNSIT